MGNRTVLLVSINYEASKGGVSRVAHLMSYSMPPSQIFSLHGSKNLSKGIVRYFQQSTLLFTWALIKYILIHRPHTILFDHVGPSSILALLPKSFLKNVVIFLHDEEAWRPVTARHAQGLEKATRLLCNSQYTYKRFIKSNPTYEFKTRVCLLAGVPSAFENVGARPTNTKYQDWFADPRPFVVFVSRLWAAHRYKGYMELVEAFGLAKLQNPQLALRLAIVGYGDDVEALKERMKVLNVEHNVEVFTTVEDDDLTNFYRESLALVFPSTREGFGFVFLEAMFYKKACIGIRNQPAEEIIEHGKSGLLLDNNHPETLCKIILEMESRPDHFKEMGKSGYTIYQDKFTTYHFKQRFLNSMM